MEISSYSSCAFEQSAPQFVLKKLPDVMVVILNTWFTEDKSPCSDISVCVLISSIVIEIKILLIKYWIISWATLYFFQCRITDG
jgi:hypothetical protein